MTFLNEPFSWAYVVGCAIAIIIIAVAITALSLYRKPKHNADATDTVANINEHTVERTAAPQVKQTKREYLISSANKDQRVHKPPYIVLPSSADKSKHTDNELSSSAAKEQTVTSSAHIILPSAAAKEPQPASHKNSRHENNATAQSDRNRPTAQNNAYIVLPTNAGKNLNVCAQTDAATENVQRTDEIEIPEKAAPLGTADVSVPSAHVEPTSSITAAKPNIEDAPTVDIAPTDSKKNVPSADSQNALDNNIDASDVSPDDRNTEIISHTDLNKCAQTDATDVSPDDRHTEIITHTDLNEYAQTDVTDVLPDDRDTVDIVTAASDVPTTAFEQIIAQHSITEEKADNRIAETQSDIPDFIKNIISEIVKSERKPFENIVIHNSEELKTCIKNPISQYESEQAFLADYFRSCTKYAKRLPIEITEMLYERNGRYLDSDTARSRARRKMINAYYSRRKEEDTLDRCEKLCREDITYQLDEAGLRDARLPPLKRAVLLCVDQKRFDDAVALCDVAIAHNLIDRKGEGYERRKEKIIQKKIKWEIRSKNTVAPTDNK